MAEHGLRCTLALEMAARRITVRELAAGAGVHPAAITKMRSNHFESIHAASFERVCRYLGMQPGELLYLEPPIDDST